MSTSKTFPPPPALGPLPSIKDADRPPRHTHISDNPLRPSSDKNRQDDPRSTNITTPIHYQQDERPHSHHQSSTALRRPSMPRHGTTSRAHIESSPRFTTFPVSGGSPSGGQHPTPGAPPGQKNASSAASSGSAALPPPGMDRCLPRTENEFRDTRLRYLAYPHRILQAAAPLFPAGGAIPARMVTCAHSIFGVYVVGDAVTERQQAKIVQRLSPPAVHEQLARAVCFQFVASFVAPLIIVGAAMRGSRALLPRIFPLSAAVGAATGAGSGVTSGAVHRFLPSVVGVGVVPLLPFLDPWVDQGVSRLFRQGELRKMLGCAPDRRDGREGTEGSVTGMMTGGGVSNVGSGGSAGGGPVGGGRTAAGTGPFVTGRGTIHVSGESVGDSAASARRAMAEEAEAALREWQKEQS